MLKDPKCAQLSCWQPISTSTGSNYCEMHFQICQQDLQKNFLDIYKKAGDQKWAKFVKELRPYYLKSNERSHFMNFEKFKEILMSQLHICLNERTKNKI